MIAEESFDLPFRELRLENYRVALEMGDKAPLGVLLIASFHEWAEFKKQQALQANTQLSLPDSAPVLNELWCDAKKFRDYVSSAISAKKLWHLLLHQRVSGLDVVSPGDFTESWRGIEKLRRAPTPSVALLNHYGSPVEAPVLDCSAPVPDCSPVTTEDWIRLLRELLDHCPIASLALVKLAENITNPKSYEEIAAEIGQVWDLLPSAQKILARISDPAGMKPPTEGGDTASAVAARVTEVFQAFLAALVREPGTEVLEAQFTQFERNSFCAIAEKYDKVRTPAASLKPALPETPSSGIVGDPGPPGHAGNGFLKTERSFGTSGIDFESLAEILLRCGDRLPSQLVRFMKDRTVATFQDVMHNVYGGDRAEGTVRTLINRTNNALNELKSRLRFSTKICRVIRHVDPE